MSTEKTEGLVIKQADFSETSRVVTYYTREHGKISAIAKGARRLKGPFEAAIDLLAVSRIVFIRKSSSSLDILTEAQLISRFRPSGRSLGSLYGGYYVAELLLGLTEEYDPHPILYDEAVRVLACLSESTDEKLPVLRFELVTLREIGQLPALDACLVCNEPVEPAGSYAIWVSQGGLICRQCQKQQYSGNRVQAGTIAIFRRLAEDTELAWKNIKFSPQQFKELRNIATSAVCHAMEKRPKMLRYLQS